MTDTKVVLRHRLAQADFAHAQKMLEEAQQALRLAQKKASDATAELLRREHELREAEKPLLETDL